MAPGQRFLHRRIGLTGGIASGKSSVGHWFGQQGLPVLDADRYARDALKPGSPGAASVLQRYGAKVRGTHPEAIDRAALGRIVFSDASERQWLEDLVHPLVRQRFETGLALHREAPVVVLMIPLLFEAGLDALCSEIWLVDCHEDQQLQRLMRRDRLDLSEAQARIAAQWPLQRKRALADHVLSNRGDPGAWIGSAMALLNQPQQRL